MQQRSTARDRKSVSKLRFENAKLERRQMTCVHRPYTDDSHDCTQRFCYLRYEYNTRIFIGLLISLISKKKVRGKNSFAYQLDSTSKIVRYLTKSKDKKVN